MKWSTKQLTRSIALVGSVVTALTALAARTEFPDFELGVATHETRADSEAASRFSNENEMAAEANSLVAPPPTRSTFMAGWAKQPGAIGYLLDVSTNSSFDSYVEGYHDLDVGDVTGRVVTGLDRGTTYHYRVRPYTGAAVGSYAEATAAMTVATDGLNIHPTFDSSITSNPNASAIEAMINRAISICESLFSDPVTIQIRFRYASSAPDGSPFPEGAAALSVAPTYRIPWSTFITALRGDARTTNDALANATLPGSAITPHIITKSGNGRAIQLNTPRAMFADGSVGAGGPYDGIVTLNWAIPFQFSRPTSATKFDAQRVTEHEMAEVIGFGSSLGHSGTDFRPQDLFSWSSFRHRHFTSAGIRYFSIDQGFTNIVEFNQDPHGDFGDWRSGLCPSPRPYVQDAFVCLGDYADIAATSPEGTNLDVIGYDLAGVPAASQTDFNQDAHPDYLLFNPVTRDTAIWYLNGYTRLRGVSGPTLPGGWRVVALADFNRDGFPDYLLYNANTRRTVVWYMRDNIHFASNTGPTLPSGWSLAGVADFNGDGRQDYLLFKATTGQSVIWYMSGAMHLSGRTGPTIPGPYELMGVADFDGNGKPDYLLYNPTTQQTAIWYLNDNVLVHHAAGPTLPDRWTFIAP